MKSNTIYEPYSTSCSNCEYWISTSKYCTKMPLSKSLFDTEYRSKFVQTEADNGCGKAKVVLKSCPFCGGHVTIRDYIDKGLVQIPYIECEKCHVRMCDCDSVDFNASNKQQFWGLRNKLITAWNRRTDNG